MNKIFQNAIKGIKSESLNLPSTKIQQQIPPQLNIDQLSSSEQQKLRMRGVIGKKINKKPIKQRLEQQWKHDKFSEKQVERRKKIQKTSVQILIVYVQQLNENIRNEDLYKLLNNQKVFICQIKINKNMATLEFSNKNSALRSVDLINSKKIGKARLGNSQTKSPIVNQNKEDNNKDKKPSIFSRFN